MSTILTSGLRLAASALTLACSAHALAGAPMPTCRPGSSPTTPNTIPPPSSTLSGQPWGIALRPPGAGGHIWTSNAGTGTTTTYIGDVLSPVGGGAAIRSTRTGSR